jgi:hypothetical protein
LKNIVRDKMTKFNYEYLGKNQKLKKQHIIDSNKKYYPPKIDDEIFHINELEFKPNGPEYLLKFGKYKGVMIKNVPIEYILWAISNINTPILDTFKREFSRRKELINNFNMDGI